MILVVFDGIDELFNSRVNCFINLGFAGPVGSPDPMDVQVVAPPRCRGAGTSEDVSGNLQDVSQQPLMIPKDSLRILAGDTVHGL